MDLSPENKMDSNGEVIMLTNIESIERNSVSKGVENVSMDCSISTSMEEFCTSICETDDDTGIEAVNLEKTLLPGTAPLGFKIIDEVYADNENRVTVSADKKPLVTITFKDNDVAGRYRNIFMSFLNDLIIKTNKNCMTQLKDLVLEVWGDLCDEASGSLVAPVFSTQDRCNPLFVVDKVPTIKDDLDIPTYGKKYDKILDKKSNIQAEKTEAKFPKLMCYNCLGNHNVKDCPEPRNQANINKNRKEFNLKNNLRNLRYHQEDDQKYSHFIPGNLSKNLRQALNLRDNELPRHIYNMRYLGYPPGWLEDAKLQHSGLSLFNSNGVAEVNSDNEEGDVVCIENKDKYDIKKIIDYPGFNVCSARGTYDECKQYWGSEIQIRNSKVAMLNMLSDKKVDEGYKRKKMKKHIQSSSNSITEVSEMDIEILDEEIVIESESIKTMFVPPLPKDESKPPEPPQEEDSDGLDTPSPNSAQEEGTELSSRTDSPSLSDLEHTKKHILEELDDSSSQSNFENPGKIKLDTSPSGTEIPVVKINTPKNKVESSPSTPVSNRRSIKSVDLGTPIIKTGSPYNKLPSSEKFSKDICDVIYFENLPDATGKYEQMSGLIQKVRSKLAEINND